MRGLVGGLSGRDKMCMEEFIVFPLEKMSFIPIEEHPLHCYQL